MTSYTARWFTHPQIVTRPNTNPAAHGWELNLQPELFIGLFHRIYFLLNFAFLFFFFNCCLICVDCTVVFVCDVAKYGPRSSFSCDKNETLRECQYYPCTSEPHMFTASASSDDMVAGNSASCTLSLEPKLTLTDVLEVLNCECETVETCDVATSSAVSLPSFELQPTTSSSPMPAQLDSSEIDNFNQSCSGNSISTPDCFVTYHGNSESAAGILLRAQSQSSSRRNPVAAAFASMLQNLSKKPS